MFLDWVKEPRRECCKGYVDYMACKIGEELGNEFNTDPFLKELEVEYRTLWIKILGVVTRVQSDTKDLIDETQPKGFTDTL